jgi:opacity protein-like surface antigen
VKLEYLYVDLGEHDSYNFGGAFPHDVSFDAHVVRVGLNYRF